MKAAIVFVTILGCTAADMPKKAPVSNTSDSQLTIVGTVTREGVECQAIRGEDGKLYTIAASGGQKLTPGTKVRITGTVAEVSTCMQGTTINATRIEVLSSSS